MGPRLPWAATPDQRVTKPTVVLNWFDELLRRAPAGIELSSFITPSLGSNRRVILLSSRRPRSVQC
jgi:hypothetical protein